MTMRDIQERTLDVVREVAAVDAAFEERRQAFSRLMPSYVPWLGYRITAVPIRSRFEINQVYHGNWLTRCKRGRTVIDARQNKYELYSEVGSFGAFRPILRGAASIFKGDNYYRELTISSSGHVTYMMKETGHCEGIFLGWVGGDVLNVLYIADTIRSQMGSADAEYAIDVEIDKVGLSGASGSFLLAHLWAHSFSERDASVVAPVRVPIWRVGPSSEFGDVTIGIMSDVCNAAGWHSLEGISIKMDDG